MMKVYRFIPLIFIVSGCTLTHKSVDVLGENEFLISSSDIAFSSKEELESDIRKKAQETCGGMQYEFIPNDKGEDIVFKDNIASDVEEGKSNKTASAKIRCIDR